MSSTRAFSIHVTALSAVTLYTMSYSLYVMRSRPFFDHTRTPNLWYQKYSDTVAPEPLFAVDTMG